MKKTTLKQIEINDELMERFNTKLMLEFIPRGSIEFSMYKIHKNYVLDVLVYGSKIHFNTSISVNISDFNGINVDIVLDLLVENVRRSIIVNFFKN